MDQHPTEERPGNPTVRRLCAVISEPRPETRTAWNSLGKLDSCFPPDYYFGDVLFRSVSPCLGWLNNLRYKRKPSVTKSHRLRAFSVHIAHVCVCVRFIISSIIINIIFLFLFLTVYTQGARCAS